MSYRKLFRCLVMIMFGGLGLFNSYKLEIRYETNSNLELLCQNGIIVSSTIIIYFTLAFFVEILVTKERKKLRKHSRKIVKKPISATEFYDNLVKEEE